MENADFQVKTCARDFKGNISRLGIAINNRKEGRSMLFKRD